MIASFRNNLTLIITLSLLFTGLTNAQVSKFGEIEKEVLALDRFEKSPEPSAVVLLEKGRLRFDSQWQLILEYRVRIKILNEEGIKYAKESFNYDLSKDRVRNAGVFSQKRFYDLDENKVIQKDTGRNVRRIKGYTYGLSDDGKVEKTKLDKDQIYEEKTEDGIKIVKFTMPALEPGVVVEYAYEQVIENPADIPDWKFQRTIPVMYSELKLQVPPFFSYNAFLKGDLEPDISELNDYVGVMGNTLEYLWVMKDVPALSSGPYTSTIENFRSKIQFQLAEIRMRGNPSMAYFQEWDDLYEELRYKGNFWGQLKPNKEFRSAADKITGKLTSDQVKIQAVYDFVAGNFTWTGEHDILVDRDITDVYQREQGSGVELNILLAQLLRELGYDANPVLISTRDHGYVNPGNVLTSQFNHVIIRVDLGDEGYYLLDATEGSRPVTQLPEKDYNGAGMLIKKKGFEWFNISAGEGSEAKYSLNDSADGSGDFTGEAGRQ